ncbi:MAG: TonB-dependent receptor [Acidobacteriota bacterium]
MILALSLFLVPGEVLAAEAGSLTGTVKTSSDESFSLATARLPDLGVVVEVASDGSFRFEDLRAGDHLLEVRIPGFGVVAQRVSVEAAEITSVVVELEAGSHSEEIVVSASALARSPGELASPTTSLSGHQLALRLESSLGETLAQEPGIRSTFYGPGASLPVIRGQTGRRIRTLESGIGTGDASAVSADHALTTEPFHAERVEVLHGPGTLLYGSSAIGGVVNVIDERIPTVRGQGIHGDVELRGGTVANERQGTLSLGGGDSSWAWNIAATSRESDDYDIPGFANVEEDEDEHEHEDGEEGEEHEEENPFGIVPNSDVDSQSFSAGATYFFGDRGFLGASVGGFDTDYGLPGGHEHGEEGHGEEGEHEEGEHEEEGHEEEAPVRLDMEQRRFDVHGQINRPFSGFEALTLRVGTTDYEHVEQEGDEVGTTYFNELFEARVQLVQNQRGRLSGSVGAQFLVDDLEAIGAEAFIPATETTQFALFTLQEIDAGPVTWQFGARFESQDADPVNQASQSHDGLSASVGVVWQLNPAFSVAASASRSVRLPAAEELFSDGLHVATRVFEIGDPTLEEEVGLGLDVSLRADSGIFSGELTVFQQEFSDFIYQAFTGLEEEGFPVVLFTQEDATFTGLEFQGRFELYDRDSHHVHLLVMGDMVDAELDRGGNLPRTPPLRLGTGVHYHGDRWNAAAEVRWIDDQDDVAENETPTEGYTLLGASLGYRMQIGGQVLDLLLRGRNLTDEEARSHTSFLKNFAPLPGRNLTLSAKFRF